LHGPSPTSVFPATAPLTDKEAAALAPLTCDVASGFDHHVPEVHVDKVGRENVTGIHQVFVMNDPDRALPTLGVFYRKGIRRWKTNEGD
jgi:hypothetical protein